MKVSCVGSWRVLSAMAGSSADGLSTALVTLYRTPQGWRYQLHVAHTTPYPSDLREALKTAPHLSPKTLLRTSIAYTDWTGDIIRTLYSQSVYDLVVWHPHVIFHEPLHGLTWSLGDAERLRVQIGKPVITHLRARDIASGGTGAPLIPNADEKLFAAYETLLNLGGIANLTHLPKSLGFDIAPCNQLLDALATQADPSLRYDPEGRLARQGKLIPALLGLFERHPFFAQPPPKALDNETVQKDFVQPFLAYEASPIDKIHTATHLIANQLNRALCDVGARFFTCTGGGTHNVFLIELLQAKAAALGITYKKAPPDLVEYREAIGFALLGLLRYLGEDNTHGKWTGACCAHSSGLASL